MEWHKQRIFCLECKYIWDGMVVDEMKDGLECPECHKMTGHVLTGEESSENKNQD